MNRVDELTLKLAEGLLTDEERRELERLVREDSEAAKAHAAMLDLVAAIRAEAPAPDLAGRTLDRIHERITEKIEVGVMHKIRARGKERVPGRGNTRRAVPPRRFGPFWLVGVAAAAIAAVAVALFLPSSRTEEGEARVTPPKRVVTNPPREATPPPPPPREEPPPPKVEIPVPPPPPVKPVPPPPSPEKKPEPPPPVEEKKPERAPEPPKTVVPAETVVVVATLEKAEKASLLVAGERKPAKAGQDLLQGQGLDAEGAAVVKYPDGSRLELRPKTVIREFTLKNGKTIDLSRGLLVAQVAEQPADRPMIFTTPQAEVRVVGTAFRISVDPEADGATQVDVTEGKVRVKRNSDGKTVEVTRGHGASVAKGTGPLAAQPSTGLVAHWKLDEAAGTTVLDSSGNLLHGKVMGDTSWVAGRVGGGLRFGTTGFLSLPGFKAPDSFTVSFWVLQAKLNTEQDWFVNFGGNEFMLMREGNMDRRQLRTGFENPQEFLTVASAIQAGQWTHLAVTYDGAEIRVYSNGSTAGSRKMTRRELRADATFGRVGAGSEAVMDDIRIYDRAVPATDIQRIMAGVHPVPAARR